MIFIDMYNICEIKLIGIKDANVLKFWLLVKKLPNS